MSDEQLDTETLIFRQLDRVMRTASLDLNNFRDGGPGGQARVLKDTDTWSHRVLMSSMFLDSFLRPIKSDEEQERIKEAYENPEAPENSSGDFYRFFRARAMFEENVKILYENNTVFQESDDMVIEDKSDSKVEPEGSEVDEEVIE